MSKPHFWQCLTILFLLLLPMSPASAQEPTEALKLHLRRDWGYGGVGEIEGNFTISVSGPVDLIRVVFWIDDQVMADLAQAPWQFRFHTGQYSPESHSLFAHGYTSTGQEMRSSDIRTQFVTSQQAGKAALSIVALLLGGLAAIAALAGGITMLLSKGRRSEQQPSRGYGWLGGAICPRCGRSFGLHWWPPNLTWVGKLDLCPHCGRWSLVRRASPEQLAAANSTAQPEGRQPLQAPINSEQMPSQEIEDSRYVDL